MDLAFPYGFDGTGHTAQAASPAAHIADMIEQILFTAPGERVNRPTFGSGTAQLVFEDVELTPDLMLGAEGEGYKIALANLEGGRIGIAAQSVGMARTACEASVAYAASARPSASRSSSSRRSPSASPTWRPRSPRRAA